MTPVQMEITALEEQLRLAELGPDADFFERVLADEAVIVTNGQAELAKRKIVEAHRPGKGGKFTSVVMSDIDIIDHEIAAVADSRPVRSHAVTVTLKFMRVWARKIRGWQIVAGTIVVTGAFSES
jgi:hypothetical protein